MQDEGGPGWRREWTRGTAGQEDDERKRKGFLLCSLAIFTVQDKTMQEVADGGDPEEQSDIFRFPCWPQEMMTVLKDYKTVLKDNGVNEDTTYVRIRPVEREGKLRADTKAKEGSRKFSTWVTWEAPPPPALRSGRRPGITCDPPGLQLEARQDR